MAVIRTLSCKYTHSIRNSHFSRFYTQHLINISFHGLCVNRWTRT